MGSGGVPGKVTTIGGTATTTPAVVNVVSPYRFGNQAQGKTHPSYSRRTQFRNLDGTNNLLVVPNGGTVALTVRPNEIRDLEGYIHSFTVTASAATVAWEAALTVA